MAITKTPRLDQTRWSSGQDPVKREDFDEDAASLEANVALYKEGPLSSIPAAGVTGRFYTVKNDINPENNGKQFYDNGSEWKAVSYSNNLVAEALGAGDTALTARAQASPTANVFQVQTSTKTNLFAVTPTGYTTNQQTIGTSGGVRLGYSSSHDNAGLFVSVAAAKPVVVVRGAANQSGNYLEFRSDNNAILAAFNSGGGATFTGGVSATNITASTSITAPSVTATGPSDFVDVDITSGAVNHVALSVNSITGQTVNLIELNNASGTRTARFIQDGTFATNGRVMVGNSQGNTGTQSFSTTTAALTVQNSISATTPAMNVYANPTGQTARIVQIYDSNKTLKFWFDNGGNASVANNLDSGTLAVGAGSNVGPTPYYNSITPKFEVVTGNDTGSYDEAVTIRHSGRSSAAVNRRVGMKFKLSTEANQTESNKWAGISAGSNSANAADVGLYFYANNNEVGNFDSTKNLNLQGGMHVAAGSNIRFGTSASDKIYLTDTPNTNVIGQQSGGTVFIRSTNFALYSGGTFTSDSLNAGGGVAMATFNSERTTVKKLTISTPATYDSLSPTLQIGSSGDAHMQFSNFSINVFSDANNTQPASLTLQQGGGILRLGSINTQVSASSRTLWFGDSTQPAAPNPNAFLVAPSGSGNFKFWTGQNPANGDIWIDHSSNTLNIYDGDQWHVFVADHTSSSVG